MNHNPDGASLHRTTRVNKNTPTSHLPDLGKPMRKILTLILQEISNPDMKGGLMMKASIKLDVRARFNLLFIDLW